MDDDDGLAHDDPLLRSDAGGPLRCDWGVGR